MKITETNWIWHDGKFVKWADAKIHVLAHSVQFGSSVFEGIRCYNTPKGPAIFRLEAHLERMYHSCKIYRMDVPYTMDEIIAAACELVEKNQLDSCYIRPMVVRGYGSAGMMPQDSTIEVFLPCWPWGTYLGAGALENGIDACVASWQRVAPNTLPAMAKVAGNYLGSQLIKLEAMANGYGEAIALGHDGMLSEGSGQNVFLVREGTLFTPPVDGTLLPGITRRSLITLADDLGIPVKEIPLPRETLYTADEVFLCGTAAEVTPVRSVDKIPVGAGKPGPITLKLQKKFLDTVTGKTPDTHSWLTVVKAERASAKRASAKR
jgi:branched-chain amino acid aminotransferase